MFAGKMLQTGPGPVETWPRLAVFRIQNTGQRPIHVEMIGWRTGLWPFRWPKQFIKQHAIIPDWDPNYAGFPPFELQPYRKNTSTLPLDSMIDAIEGMGGDPFFARLWPLLGLRRTSIFAVMHLEEGGVVVQRVQPDLKEALFQAEVARAARQLATQATAQPDTQPG